MIPYLLAAGMWAVIFVFFWCMCVVASRSDEWSERKLQDRRMRERRDECEARNHIYGPPWRG